VIDEVDALRAFICEAKGSCAADTAAAAGYEYYLALMPSRVYVAIPLENRFF
jgi:hypothetical protein